MREFSRIGIRCQLASVTASGSCEGAGFVGGASVVGQAVKCKHHSMAGR